MIQGLFHRDIGEMALGGMQEGATGSREPDSVNFVAASAAQTLVDGIVLGVNGEERLALLVSFGDDEVASGDQALLVGYSDGLSRLNSFVGSFESSDPN